MIDDLVITFVAIAFVVGFAGIMHYFVNRDYDDTDRKL